jgi:hypothetical protein
MRGAVHQLAEEFAAIIAVEQAVCCEQIEVSGSKTASGTIEGQKGKRRGQGAPPASPAVATVLRALAAGYG